MISKYLINEMQLAGLSIEELIYLAQTVYGDHLF